MFDKKECVKILWSLFFSLFPSEQGGGIATVSKHTDKKSNTQPISVISKRFVLEVWTFDNGANNFPNVRTIASMTEDLLTPAINDLRPRNVNRINTLQMIMKG